MTTAFWCVLIVGLLPYVATVTAKTTASGGFDNRNPRQWLARQEGLSARAHAAQQNGFETFPLFAVAVIVAHLNGADQPLVDLLALVYLGSRILYLIVYLLDMASLRSVVWFVGMVAAVWIFVA